jgi:Uncharacterized BCR, YaiI/YqxD family COG1671
MSPGFGQRSVRDRRPGFPPLLHRREREAADQVALQPGEPDRDRLAERNLMTALREAGEITSGGRPSTRQDRSRFLDALDAAIQAIRRTGR